MFYTNTRSLSSGTYPCARMLDDFVAWLFVDVLWGATAYVGRALGRLLLLPVRGVKLLNRRR